jgi:hypothetical protein
MRLTVDVANNYTTEQKGREAILLDGESSRFTLHGRYGVWSRLEVGVEVPYVIIGGGFLDSFIEGYHHTFGFPNGGRDQAPQNRLVYRYEKDGQMRLNMVQSGAGLGDVRLTGGWQFFKGEAEMPGEITLRASLKLPTGDSDTLRGSGSTDLALWLVGKKDFQMPLGRGSVFGGMGAMAMTDGKVLKDQQRPLVGFGTLGIGWSPLNWLALKVQVDSHTSFYRDSDFKQVDGASVQLTMGGTLAFSPRTALDIGVTEDLTVTTSPDVVFHLSLSHRF